jgi:hypothetical protein
VWIGICADSPGSSAGGVVLQFYSGRIDVHVLAQPFEHGPHIVATALVGAGEVVIGGKHDLTEQTLLAELRHEPVHRLLDPTLLNRPHGARRPPPHHGVIVRYPDKVQSPPATPWKSLAGASRTAMVSALPAR